MGNQDSAVDGCSLSQAPAPRRCKLTHGCDLHKFAGKWEYRYYAVERVGDTVDFLLTAKRNKAAARLFLERAINQDYFRGQARTFINLNDSVEVLTIAGFSPTIHYK